MWPRSVGSVSSGGLVVRSRRRLAHVGVEQLLELHEQAIVDAVVAEADRSEHEGVVGATAEVRLAEHRPILRRRQVVEDVAQPRRDRLDLQLLAAHGDALATVAGAEVEDPRSRLADGAGRELVDLVELVEHDGH